MLSKIIEGHKCKLIEIEEKYFEDISKYNKY